MSTSKNTPKIINLNKTFTIQLDFTSIPDFKHITKKYKLKPTLLQKNGPGGNLPLIQLTGTKINITKYLKYYTNYNISDTNFFLTLIY
jgi:hypothetical protein